MIRCYSLSFLGKNLINVPLLTRRFFLFPYKQPLVEYVTFFNEGKKFESDTNFLEGKKGFINGLPYVNENVLTPEERKRFSESFPQFLKYHGPEDIIKMMEKLGKINSRPVLAIKALCDALLNKQQNLSEWHCCRLLLNLSKLNYRHEPVIKFVVKKLEHSPNIFKESRILKSVLHSLMLLRHRDCDFIEIIVKSVLENVENLSCLLLTLKTLAFLNVQTPYLDELFKHFTELEVTDFPEAKHYATFIWSCVLLGKHNSLANHHLENVLSADFLDKIDINNADYQFGLKLKLLQINAVTSLMPSYKGPLLNSLPIYKYLCPPLSKQKSAFLKSVKDTIIYVLGNGGYKDSVMDTGRGTFLDIACVLNSENSAKILSKNVEMVKLGIMLLSFNDICNDGTIIGIHAFNLKILQHLGYEMVVLKDSDYPFNGKLSKKITFLQNEIKNAVEGTDDVKEIEKKKTENT